MQSGNSTAPTDYRQSAPHVANLDLIHRGANFIYGQSARSYNLVLRARLSVSSEYSYTADWVTLHTDNWQRALPSYRAAPAIRMLEVGSHEGRSTVWFLKNILTASDASIDCVDWFFYRGQEPRFDHNIRISGCAHKVRKIQARSEDSLTSLPYGAYDIAYVDADHRARHVLLDAMLVWRLLKPGGILIFDDYLWEEHSRPPIERPQLAIDLFLEALEGRYELLHKALQVIVRKLR